MSDEILLETRGNLAVITLNRPDHLNALYGDMLLVLRKTLQTVAADPGIRAVVLTGAGRGFCAGGDVKMMFQQNEAKGAGAEGAGLENMAYDIRKMMETCELLHEMPKPTIAMLRGPTAGGGMGIALACDLRFAADDLIMTTAFALVGVSGDSSCSYFLTQLVGPAKAKELFFTAKQLNAQQALEVGLVNQVVSGDELEEKTLKITNQLANGPTIAFNYIKRNINAAAAGTALKEVLNLEALHMVRTMGTEDHKRAAKAFVEKRQPTFEGR